MLEIITDYDGQDICHMCSPTTSNCEGVHSTKLIDLVQVYLFTTNITDTILNLPN